ncbi:tRNA uridine-5-carboxymethylaminomethyl(34) synthesis GTPase MnmE [bacterium 1XD21-13]|nr:tRNA uridine-5-carboxymethylaminomethyl(34) synthesis GTPase MnmE [bacterium 1XD21-13]
MNQDTIVAAASAMSSAGIGIIRISGENAFSILERIFQFKNERKKVFDQPSYTIHYGNIYDGEELLDEVIVLLMKGPHSYTMEDTVEIDCHGGILLMRRILETVIREGARPAEPGEFTKRAFLNGRIDLSQAEAVMDVIQAGNRMALESSLSQLKGSVANRIRGFREKILYETAFLESALDDPEHISLEGYGDRLSEILRKLNLRMEALIDSFENGRIIKEGIKTVILGKPNAGKSSLLNVLLGEERAIVTEIAGTTRDILEEELYLNGISLRLLDTAGIRKTEDLVEQIGVGRAKEQAEQADLILYVVDTSCELDESDVEICKILEKKKAIIVLNKSDLQIVVTEDQIREKIGSQHPVISISAKQKEGIQYLEDTIRDLFFKGKLSFNDEFVLTNIRHKTALEDAKKSLEMVLDSILNGMPEDFYTIDLMDAYHSLGTILGEDMGEDLIQEIFSKFCTGK